MLIGILKHLLQVAPKDIVYYVQRNHRIFSSVDNFKGPFPGRELRGLSLRPQDKITFSAGKKLCVCG